MDHEHTPPFIPEEHAIYLIRVRRVEVFETPTRRFLAVELETLEASNPASNRRVFRWACVVGRKREVPPGETWLQYPAWAPNHAGVEEARAFFEALGASFDGLEGLPNVAGRTAWMLVHLITLKDGRGRFGATRWRRAIAEPDDAPEGASGGARE